MPKEKRARRRHASFRYVTYSDRRVLQATETVATYEAGNADFAIAIRTALMRDGTAYVQAGGGVVADSNGPYEHTEASNKARAVLNAIAAAETLTAPDTSPNG